MASMQRKLRQALSAVKDQTKIGLARVANNRLRDLDVAILKATSQDDVPMDEKYVKEILHLVSNSPGSVTTLATGLTKRLRKTQNWIVALKGLMLIHRLLRVGDRNFEQEMRLARTKGLLTLSLSTFKDSSSCRSCDFTAFIHAYSHFLDEGLNSGSFTPASDINGASGGPISACQGDSQREMKTDHIIAGYSTEWNNNNGDDRFECLFDRTPKSQRLLDCAIACKPVGVCKRNRLVQIALKSIVREIFRLYGQICDGIAKLLDNFFDMRYDHCVLCFEIYKKAASQSHELSDYFDTCKSAGVCGSYEYPTVEKISQVHIAAWEEFMRGFSHMSSSSNSMDGSSAISELSSKSSEFESSFHIECLGSGALTCNRSIGGYSAEQVKRLDCRPFSNAGYLSLEEHKKQKIRQEDHIDLIKFDNSPATSVEQRDDRLSVTPFSDPLETTITTDWENFNVEETEDGKASWELALESSTAPSSTCSSLMSGGFDNLILDSLYSQPQTHQMCSSNALYTTSASSVAQPASTLLALPAPHLGVEEDPFRASESIAPPSYVQMEDAKRKYCYLLEEQQFWQQYKSNGMRGCHGFIQLYNNPFCVPFTQHVPHVMPGSALQNYIISAAPFAYNAYCTTMI